MGILQKYPPKTFNRPLWDFILFLVLAYGGIYFIAEAVPILFGPDVRVFDRIWSTLNLLCGIGLLRWGVSGVYELARDRFRRRK